MKVFLSWSGEISKDAACILRDWLPSVIQSIEPYVSSEDIEKGSRWATDIAKELERSFFGIICVTKDNYNAPWVNFEAGALSKSVDSSRVCPFLVNLKKAELPQCPLLQFQLTVYDKEDVFRLVTGINASLEQVQQLDEARLKKAFDVWWPVLQQQIEDLLKKSVHSSATKQNVQEKKPQLLEEILDLVREQQKVLRSPETLFPAEYFASLLKLSGHFPSSNQLRNMASIVTTTMERQWNIIKKFQETKSLNEADIAEFHRSHDDLERVALYLANSANPEFPMWRNVRKGYRAPGIIFAPPPPPAQPMIHPSPPPPSSPPLPPSSPIT